MIVTCCIIIGAFTSAGQKTDERPQIVVDPASFDLGRIRDGEHLSRKVLLRNAGRAELVIREIKSDCGCTVVDIPSEARRIAPGEVREVSITFDSTGRARPEAQTKQITILSNDPVNPEVVVTLDVLVESECRLSPVGSIHLQSLRRGDESRRTLDVLPGSIGKPVRVDKVEVDPEMPLTVRVDALEQDSQHGSRITFKALDDALLGVVRGQITLHIVVEDRTIERRVSIQAMIVGDLEFKPQLLNLINQKVTPGKKLAPITLTRTTRQPLRILSVDENPVLDFDIREGARKDGTEFVIQPLIRENAPSGPFGVQIRIRTDSLDQPIVEVPAFGFVTPPLFTDPSEIYLCDDGSVIGASRQLRLVSSAAGVALNNVAVATDSSLVKARVLPNRTEEASNTVLISVYLAGEVPDGRHSATLTIHPEREDVAPITVPITLLGRHDRLDGPQPRAAEPTIIPSGG
ncbi:MAG: hypothetical protein FLDDKLPJ_02619 [Phycisphaerae bacterium]|nr:hypothetical protein [Phycisphaerae bacterium]